MHVPCAAEQAGIASGKDAQQDTNAALHAVWHRPYVSGPASAAEKRTTTRMASRRARIWVTDQFHSPFYYSAAENRWHL